MNGKRVFARFNPKVKENLRGDAVLQVGNEFEFYHCWKITEEDGGPYVGQDAWMADDPSFNMGWVPTEDLDFIKTLYEGWD